MATIERGESGTRQRGKGQQGLEVLGAQIERLGMLIVSSDVYPHPPKPRSIMERSVASEC